MKIFCKITAYYRCNDAYKAHLYNATQIKICSRSQIEINNFNLDFNWLSDIGAVCLNGSTSVRCWKWKRVMIYWIIWQAYGMESFQKELGSCFQMQQSLEGGTTMTTTTTTENQSMISTKITVIDNAHCNSHLFWSTKANKKYYRLKSDPLNRIP